jgi:CRISPR system Cascade subunit CasD
MQVLRLILSAPLMSFGAPSLHGDRPTDQLPGRSMLTGLLANALGWEMPAAAARHTALQAALRYAAVQLRAPSTQLSDFQTAFTRKADRLWSSRGELDQRGGHSGTHRGGPANMTKHYLVDAAVAVGLTLTDVPDAATPDAETPDAETPEAATPEAGIPDLATLAEALRRPARPLFIGRKCCVPDVRPFAGLVEADSPASAIAALLQSDHAFACWDPGFGPDRGAGCPIATTVADRRDWRGNEHRGSSRLLFDRLHRSDAALPASPPGGAPAPQTGSLPCTSSA